MSFSRVAIRPFVLQENTLNDALKQADYNFFLQTGIPLSARWHNPFFWNSIAPQLGLTSSAVGYSVLAVSAALQQYFCNSPDQVQTATRRGQVYYAQACKLLMPARDITPEEALVSSLVLWTFDIVVGRDQQSFVHANATVKILQSLESTRRQHSDKAVQIYEQHWLVDPVKAFLRDSHFPLSNAESVRMLDDKARSVLTASTDVNDQVSSLDSSPENPFIEIVNADDVMSVFWLITMAISKQQVQLIWEALTLCEANLGQFLAPTTHEQAVFEKTVSLFCSFCELRLHDFIPRSSGDVDTILNRMMGLIQATLESFRYNEEHARSNIRKISVVDPAYHSSEYYKGILGILGVIASRAESDKLQFKALHLLDFSRGTIFV